MIGYYVHHHGVGHLTRAGAIARHLHEPVTVLSSRVRPDGSGFESWIALDGDTGSSAGDVSANGVFHWAPVDVDGHTARLAAIAAWVAETRPRLVVVDVSVEVAVFVRLLGIPVVVMAIPGHRVDDAHTLAYRLADHIIAPWSAAVYDPMWLRAFAHKTTYVGSISRFSGQPVTNSVEPRSVLVLGGAGGSRIDADAVVASSSSTPHFRWRSAGIAGGPWVEDLWPLLTSSSIVITHAGQNAVADVAAARASAVVIAQDRPFDEQRATATALADADVAVCVDHWPEPSQWPDVLDRAAALDTARWDLLRVDGAAERAAAVLESL